MLDHVPIFFGHELLESTGKLHIIKTHWNTSLYRFNGNPLPIRKEPVLCNKPAGIRGWKSGLTRSHDVYPSTHGSKAQKRLSMRNVAASSSHILKAKFYNFLIINATSHKAHHPRKKA
jgi:hypothetical protein